MPLITRATFRVGLLWAMGFIAADYVSALTLNGLGWERSRRSEPELRA